jgi:hypothetical protein
MPSSASARLAVAPSAEEREQQKQLYPPNDSEPLSNIEVIGSKMANKVKQKALAGEYSQDATSRDESRLKVRLTCSSPFQALTISEQAITEVEPVHNDYGSVPRPSGPPKPVCSSAVVRITQLGRQLMAISILNHNCRPQ